MSILSRVQKRFRNAGNLGIRRVEIADPVFDLFLDSCYLALKGLNGQDLEQQNCRLKLVGFYRRLSSFAFDDFGSELLTDLRENDLPSLLNALSQFHGVEHYFESLKRSLDKLFTRDTNPKYWALRQFCEGLPDDCDLQIALQGHKWRSIPASSTDSWEGLAGFNFSNSSIAVHEKTVLTMSPHILDSRLINQLVFGGVTNELLVFLYRKERIKAPETQIFIANKASADVPLISFDYREQIKYEFDQGPEDEGLSNEIEPDLFSDETVSDGISVLRLLLASDEEIMVEAQDEIWVRDMDSFFRILAIDLAEGMHILLRPILHVEPPEIYLDRSEVWRTPLRNLINSGFRPEDLANAVANRCGVTVNSRMIMSWQSGDVLGPEDQSVFEYLIEELKVRKVISADIESDLIESWWGDLVKARASQTSLGVKHYEDTLKEVKESLSHTSNQQSSKFEFSEILVREKVLLDEASRSKLAVSNRRRVRIF